MLFLATLPLQLALNVPLPISTLPALHACVAEVIFLVLSLVGGESIPLATVEGHLGDVMDVDVHVFHLRDALAFFVKGSCVGDVFGLDFLN